MDHRDHAHEQHGGDRLVEMVVEACALMERAECRGLDDGGWAALAAVRTQLCLLAADIADGEAADTAGEVVCCIDAVLRQPAPVEERGAA